ncbi:MAG TPA: [protein-PII] uridylyltransferase, partial [Pirellulales bacterium]
MTSVPGMRPGLLAARQRLIEGREKIRHRHAQNTPSAQICNAIADLYDSIVLELFEEALADLGESGTDGLSAHIALVPHGGYGRRDVAPFSDVDLMILYAKHVWDRVARLIERLVRDLSDVRMELGQSVRTPNEACQLARGDATICTSLIESRFLAGSETLYARYFNRYEHQTRRHARRLIATIAESRHEERAQYGETVYLLQPNVKRSPGGLRDIQLIRWVGFARYGVADPDGLRMAAALSKQDHAAIRQAGEFLLRIRNEMHFTAGKANDVLDNTEQMRLAELYGYQGSAGMLPVEQFMQEYFRMTNTVSHLASRFVATARSGPRWLEIFSPLYSHSFEDDFRVSWGQVSVRPQSLEKVRGDISQILRLADLANRYNKPIAHHASEAIRATVGNLPDVITPEVGRRFLSLIDHPARLGEMLRTLHEIGVLEKIIPPFAHARSLLQFNEYHKYTVDEHSIRAVEEATRFTHDQGPMGRVYRRIKRKWLLHLALLLHDLGKGFAEDHSEVGARMADEISARLGLSESDAEILRFLVHKHLQMSHLAFRRDTSDPQLIVRFAVEVGSPETLQMLYVLTAADLAAVGPDVLNAWKIDVLTGLYRRTMEHLSGHLPALRGDEWLSARREEIISLLNDDEDRSWWSKQLAALPAAYLEKTPISAIIADLSPLRRLGHGDVSAQAQFISETGAVEIRVGAYEAITPGVFHKLCGALASQGLQILSAEINTLADGLIFDRFWVHDPDFADRPPPSRLREVEQAVIKCVTNPADARPTFRKVWRAGDKPTPGELQPLPTQVRIDNSTSDRFTVVEFFAADRMGLLYTIG